MMKVRQIMSRPVELVDPTTTLAAAAATMRDNDVGCLLVGRNNRLLGLVTDRDLAIRVLADTRCATNEPIWTVMSSDLVCCFEDDAVAEAARLMAEHSIRRLPVLNRQDGLAGIVSLSDVQGGQTRNKPWQVTYYKEFTDNRGNVHEVPLATIYVARPDSVEDATAAAGKIMSQDWCDRLWKGAPDGCRVEGAGKAQALPPVRRPLFAHSHRRRPIGVSSTGLNSAIHAPGHHGTGARDRHLSTG